jgi:hypothetical protein
VPEAIRLPAGVPMQPQGNGRARQLRGAASGGACFTRARLVRLSPSANELGQRGQFVAPSGPSHCSHFHDVFRHKPWQVCKESTSCRYAATRLEPLTVHQGPGPIFRCLIYWSAPTGTGEAQDGARAGHRDGVPATFALPTDGLPGSAACAPNCPAGPLRGAMHGCRAKCLHADSLITQRAGRPRRGSLSSGLPFAVIAGQALRWIVPGNTGLDRVQL